jgi:L-serine/L-threonine ammonia-lyase
VHELADELASPPAAVVASVGGGGLVLGVLHGLAAVGWTQTVHVIAAETFGAHSFASAVAAGQLVTLPAITSVAKSLGASKVSPVRAHTS